MPPAAEESYHPWSQRPSSVEAGARSSLTCLEPGCFQIVSLSMLELSTCKQNRAPKGPVNRPSLLKDQEQQLWLVGSPGLWQWGFTGERAGVEVGQFVQSQAHIIATKTSKRLDLKLTDSPVCALPCVNESCQLNTPKLEDILACSILEGDSRSLRMCFFEGTECVAQDSILSDHGLRLLPVVILFAFYSSHRIARRFACFAQKLSHRRKQSQCDLLNESSGQLPATCSPAASNNLNWNLRVKMTQQMQNLHLSQSRKHSAPSSPNAAKRLYRNLSEKLKGSHSSFDEAYFRTRTDRLSLRKTSVNFQGNEAIFEAVEQQDMDAVQILLYQYSAEELDLNTPNSEGLTPLDIAIMTNNVPIAKILLKSGARESPHFVSLESRAMHLNTLVQEAQERVSELSAQVENEGFSLDNTEKEKQLKAWEWRYRLYRRMKTGFEHARAPEVPTSACLTVTSSTSLTVSFQEPLSVNAAVLPQLSRLSEIQSKCLQAMADVGICLFLPLSSSGILMKGFINAAQLDIFFLHLIISSCALCWLPQACCLQHTCHWKVSAKVITSGLSGETYFSLLPLRNFGAMKPLGGHGGPPGSSLLPCNCEIPPHTSSSGKSVCQSRFNSGAVLGDMPSPRSPQPAPSPPHTAISTLRLNKLYHLPPGSLAVAKSRRHRG
ncbi:Ankyrin repeat and fibronectin type-III domain-containing protein 1, partial [Galemys pyrenaicus]